MQRRDALHLLGGAVACSLAGCGWDQHDAAPVPQACGTPSNSTSFGAVIYGSDDLDLAMQRIVGCGGKYVRVGIDTSSLQRVDAVLAKAEKYGLRVVLISQYSPQPVNRVAYAQECGAIHRRFAAYDPIWEIWNEPNLANYWGAAPNVTNYANLAMAAGTALRNNGATQIWSGGTSGIDVRWTYALLRQGVFNVLNGCAVHSYKPAPAAFAEYVALQKLLPAGMPIHTTETCVASDRDDQSDFLRGMWYIHRRLSLPTLIWCELRDFTAGDHPPYNYPYGMLWSTYRPKDVYYVAKSLTSSCE